MQCPQCMTTLVVAERQGVEIDHCPKCRGVWLDRGELDKVIERSNAYAAAYGGNRGDDGGDDGGEDGGDFGGDLGDAGRGPGRGPGRGGGFRPPRQQAAPDPQQPHPHGYRKRKSFWEELFD